MTAVGAGAHDPTPPISQVSAEARMTGEPDDDIGCLDSEELACPGDTYYDWSSLEHVPWRLVSAHISLGTITGHFPEMVRKAPKPRRQRKPRVRPPDGLLTKDDAAVKLGCSTRTLDGYVASGALKYVAGGLGKRRQRKLFTDADINTFIADRTREESLCPSDATRGRRSGSLTSRSTVVAFSGLQRRPSGAKPKP